MFFFFLFTVQYPNEKRIKKNTFYSFSINTHHSPMKNQPNSFMMMKKYFQAHQFHQFNEINFFFTLSMSLVVYLILINLLLSSAYAPTTMTISLSSSSTIATFYPVALCLCITEQNNNWVTGNVDCINQLNSII